MFSMFSDRSRSKICICFEPDAIQTFQCSSSGGEDEHKGRFIPQRCKCFQCACTYMGLAQHRMLSFFLMNESFFSIFTNK